MEALEENAVESARHFTISALQPRDTTAYEAGLTFTPDVNEWRQADMQLEHSLQHPFHVFFTFCSVILIPRPPDWRSWEEL